ncbi:MAG: hypothetical protein IKU43_08355 [Clostridia bacterium]|nr:hypothetical protein [Clostridia bacterium]
MKNALKAILKYIIPFSAVLLLPVILLALMSAMIPAQYENTFLAGLAPKYDRLYSVEGEKIIVVGGSNVAFGLDSERLEKYTGKPCVNFGLYADLGTKAMLDLSRDAVGNGDIVIICPETDPQTYSLHFDARNMWQASEADYSMISKLPSDDLMKVLASFPEYYKNKKTFFATGTTPNPEGVYRADSFNALGDISYERKYNTMLSMVDENKLVSLSPELITDEFAQYLNEYARDAEKKGAKVYFSFPPINAGGLTKDTTEDSIYGFYTALCEKLDFEIISNVNDYIMDEEYFFDTNYHLNDTGVEYRTSLLAKDLMRAGGDTSVNLSLSFPMAPVRPADFFGFSVNDDTTGYFEYKEEEISGAKVAVLVGLTAKGTREKLLTMPISYNGLPVVAIEKDAFSSSETLERIFVSDNSNLTSFRDGAFDNCKKLRSIELTVPPTQLKVSPNIFGESAKDVMFYVTKELYPDYASDYEWGSHFERITLM